MDERLRQLERQRLGADPAAAHRLLLERVRAGRIGPQRLRLAAYCGDPGARAILGAEAPDAPTASKAWFMGLAGFGKRVVVFTAILTGRLVEPAWERRGMWLGIEALRSAEQWYVCPCARHRRRATDLARDGKPPIPYTTRTAGKIAESASHRDRSRSEEHTAARLGAQDASAAAWNAPEVFTSAPAEEVASLVALCGLTQTPSPSQMRALVAARLGAWVLGESEQGA